MTFAKRVVVITGLFAMFFHGTSRAAPSESMLQAMKAPISVFDFVLFQLAYELKFTNVDGRHSYLNELKYREDDDLIQFIFVMPQTHMRWMTFKNSDEQRKEKILRAEAEILNSFIRRLIRRMQIRKTWHAVNIDEDALKADLSDRLTITLNALDVQGGFIYQINRSHLGDISYNRESLLNKQEGRL